jgi:hypothetical protein
MNKNSAFVIRPYTHKELAQVYRVSWPTFKKWLHPFRTDLGEKAGHFYTARQVEIIGDRLS